MSETFDSFFGGKAIEKTNKKSWDTDWIRSQEANILELGENRIHRPMAQNYVVYRAIRAISENVPQAQYKIYEGTDQVALDHPLQKLFNKPNPKQSRYEFWETLSAYLNLYGEVFIYLVPSLGQLAGTNTLPAQLFPLHPLKVKHTLKDNMIVGWVFDGKMPIRPEEMIHIKLFNPYDVYRGLSPILSIRNEMEGDFSSAHYNKKFFDNGAVPDVIIEIDKDKEIGIDELRKLKRLWNQQHQGTSNAHKTAFLLGGMSAKNLAISQKDAEFLSGREFARTAILAAFGVPPFVAGFTNKGEVNRSTAQASKNVFWTSTIVPQLQRIQEKLFCDFFIPFAPGFIGKFDLSGIPELKPDAKESTEVAKNLMLMGYTRNEVNHRLALDMPVDPDGDVRYMPMNLIEVGDSSDAVPAKSTKNVDKIEEIEQLSKDLFDFKTKIRNNHIDVQAKFERVLHKKLKRYIFNVRSNSLKIVNNSGTASIVSKLKDLLNDSKPELTKLVEPVFRQIIHSGIDQAFGVLGIERSVNDLETKQDDETIQAVEAVVLADRAKKITGISDTIFDSLKSSLAEGIQEGEAIPVLAKRTREVFNVASNRSITIARTESNSLLNGSAAEVYKRENVQQKEWITTADDKARESHIAINGEVVHIDQQFSNGLRYPGDSTGDASEVVNCRCAIAPVVR